MSGKVKGQRGGSGDITRFILKPRYLKPAPVLSQKAFSSHSLPACFQPPQARQGCLPSCPLLYSPTALVTAAVGLQELRFQRRCPVSEGTAPSCTTEHHRVESVCAPRVGQGEGRLSWLGCVAACRHLVCSPETGAGGRGSYSRRERMLYSYI